MSEPRPETEEPASGEAAPAAQPDTPPEPSDTDNEIRCTLCGLRACWSSA